MLEVYIIVMVLQYIFNCVELGVLIPPMQLI